MHICMHAFNIVAGILLQNIFKRSFSKKVILLYLLPAFNFKIRSSLIISVWIPKLNMKGTFMNLINYLMFSLYNTSFRLLLRYWKNMNLYRSNRLAKKSKISYALPKWFCWILPQKEWKILMSFCQIPSYLFKLPLSIYFIITFILVSLLIIHKYSTANWRTFWLWWTRIKLDSVFASGLTN